MKPLGYALLLLALVAVFSCTKEEEKVSEIFKMLTTPTWTSDSLLVDGVEASGPGQLLEKFKGDMNLYKDGTGVFGEYSGTWRLSADETELTIITESLSFPLTTKIEELTSASLKITTGFPLAVGGELKIRLTFKAK